MEKLKKDCVDAAHSARLAAKELTEIAEILEKMKIDTSVDLVIGKVAAQSSARSLELQKTELGRRLNDLDTVCILLRKIADSAGEVLPKVVKEESAVDSRTVS